MAHSPHRTDALTTPHRAGGLLALLSPGHRGRRVLHVLGAVAGVLLLFWAFFVVFSEGNAPARARLTKASTRDLSLLAIATCASVVMIGVTFWVTLLPLRRLPLRQVITINALAIFLTVVPFKLGFAVRVLLHHRVDALPFKLIFAWLTAMAALGAASIIPLTAVSFWRADVDALWWGTVIIGIVATHVAGYLLSVWTRGGAYGGRLSRLILHADDITSRPSVHLMHAGSRFIEMGLLAVRFSIAGGIVLGSPLTAGQSIILATTFVFLSVVSPLGTLGPREWGVALVGLAIGLDGNNVVMLTMLVGCSEALIAAAMGALGALFLRRAPRPAHGLTSTGDPSPGSPGCSAPTSPG